MLEVLELLEFPMLDHLGSDATFLAVLSLVWWRLRRVEEDTADITRRFNEYLEERAK